MSKVKYTDLIQSDLKELSLQTWNPDASNALEAPESITPPTHF